MKTHFEKGYLGGYKGLRDEAQRFMREHNREKRFIELVKNVPELQKFLIKVDRKHKNG